MSAKDQRQFVRELKRSGCTVERRTRSNHYKITTPRGAILFMPSTPSDHRAQKNTRAAVRRAMEGRPV